MVQISDGNSLSEISPVNRCFVKNRLAYKMTTLRARKVVFLSCFTPNVCHTMWVHVLLDARCKWKDMW